MQSVLKSNHDIKLKVNQSFEWFSFFVPKEKKNKKIRHFYNESEIENEHSKIVLEEKANLTNSVMLSTICTVCTLYCTLYFMV